MAEGNTATIPNLEDLKRLQKVARTKITITCNTIKSKVRERESRRVVQNLLEVATRLFAQITKYNEQLTAIADEAELLQ